MDYSKPKLVLVGMTPQLLTDIQETLFTYGIDWPDTRRSVQHLDTEVLWVSTKDNLMLKSERSYYNTEYKSGRLYDSCIVHLDHKFHMTEWLKVHKGATVNPYIPPIDTPQPQPTATPPMTTPPTNPYDMMVNDIINRVTANIRQELDGQMTTVDKRIEDVTRRALDATLNVTNQVDAIVKDAIGRYMPQRTIVTIEDRRITPAVATDINEPTHRALPEVIGVLKSGCWCAVVGPTGGGKTLGGLQYATAAKMAIVGIKTMSNTIMPHDLIGFIDANGKYRKGAWTDSIIGYVYDGGEHPQCDSPKDTPALIIIDEMDNANANIIMLVKALAVGTIAMPYGQQKVNPNLQVLATMNTWGLGASREYVGRMAQDAALLNEFNFVEWDYDNDFEFSLLERLFNSYSDKGDYTRDDIVRLYEMFKSMRGKADQQKVRCIISTRNIINTAKLLLNNPKWTIHNTLKKTVYKGLKDDEVKRIEAPEHWTKKAPAPTTPATTQKVSLYGNNPPANAPF